MVGWGEDGLSLSGSAHLRPTTAKADLPAIPWASIFPWPALILPFKLYPCGTCTKAGPWGDAPASDWKLCGHLLPTWNSGQRPGLGTAPGTLLFTHWSLTVDHSLFSEFTLPVESGWFYPWESILTVSEGIRYSLTTQLCSLGGLVKYYSFWKQLDQTRELVADIASHWECKLHLGWVHCLQQAGLFLKI